MKAGLASGAALLLAFFFCALTRIPSRGESIPNYIESLPTVREVYYWHWEHEWKNVCSAQIVMRDGSVMHLKFLRFNDSGELVFEDVYRFGAVVPRAFRYDKGTGKIDMRGMGTIFSRHTEIPVHREIDAIMREGSATDLLLNYERLALVLEKIPVADSSVLSYWGETEFGEKKTSDEYLALVRSEHSMEDSGSIFGYFLTSADDDFLGKMWKSNYR